MIVDASALLSILEQENDAERIAHAMGGAASLSISAATLFETALVICGRRGDAGEAELDLLVRKLELRIVPFGDAQVGHARRAFRLYGKGRHAARLNFGDCFSYALAKATGEPLLFKGDDFAQTDIEAAAY